MVRPTEKWPTVGDQRTMLHPVPGSKYGEWLIETFRECLNCDWGFWSWGPENRICGACRSNDHYQALSDFLANNERLLYDHELDPEWEPPSPEAVAQEKHHESFWEASKEKKARKLKCPECGEIVYRPGTADQHSCFTRHMQQLKETEFELRMAAKGIRKAPAPYSLDSYRNREKCRRMNMEHGDRRYDQARDLFDDPEGL